MLNISIKAKLYALLAVIMGILLISSVMSFRSITPIQAEWDFYENNIAQRQSLLMDIKSQFGYGGTIHNFKNYILRGNDKYFVRLKANFAKLSNAIDEYQALSDISVAERQALQDIRKVADNYKTQTNVAHGLIKQGKNPHEIDTVVKVSDAPAFEAFTVLDKAYKKLTEHTSAVLTAKIDSTLNSTLMTSVFLIVIIFVSIFLITQVIARRLDEVRLAINNIESNNDLSVHLATDRKDEISELSLSLNKLLQRFSTMIGDIIGAAVDVGVESSKQASIVEQTVKGIHQQHEEINLVSNSMKLMSETVQNVSINTEQAVTSAQLATEGVEIGSQQMSQTIQVMNDLNNRIETASQTISKLEEESQNISSVLEVIHGISEQTNLLALNAAIEAARAGEQGRGFAVVADEVRALAARTKDSTDEIRIMIERLQAQVKTVVKVMDESRQDTRRSSEKAAEAGDTLNKISSDIDAISSVMSQIASTSSEQFQVSVKMGEHINSINDKADVTAQSADATLVATAHIGEKTELLREQATRFKIDNTISQLQQAKAAHLAWRSKLMAYLSGEQHIDSRQLHSHKDCILGKWYYDEGLKQFAHIPAMQELEPPHEEIHQVIHSVVELKQAGEDDKAMQVFERITPLSHEIVRIIDKIIEKI